MTDATDDAAELLEGQATAFAEELTATVRAVVGSAAHPFRATVKVKPGAHTSGFVIRQDPSEGIVLAVDGSPMLRLKVSLRCTWDHRGDYLAVEESSFEVLAIVAGASEPLLRIEFIRSPKSGIPCAHMHVHAHRDAITHVMDRCGDKSDRAKRRRKSMEHGTALPRLSDLHLPLGGPRFRPCLEDLLQMLIDELGVDAEKGAAQALAAGRAEWRRKQLGASVRDSPETAARTLREMKYTVTAPPSGPVADRMDKLEAL